MCGPPVAIKQNQLEPAHKDKPIHLCVQIWILYIQRIGYKHNVYIYKMYINIKYMYKSCYTYIYIIYIYNYLYLAMFFHLATPLIAQLLFGAHEEDFTKFGAVLFKVLLHIFIKCRPFFEIHNTCSTQLGAKNLPFPLLEGDVF